MATQSALRSTDDVTHWCGNVLEAFALTVENVTECHDELDEDCGSVADLVRAARRRPSAFPNPVAFVRDTLVASDRGVDAPTRYWANAPEVHLDALFSPFDCRVTVEWRRDDTRRIVLEDADETEFRATVTYPDTPLGRDNYPALLDAVNRDLLAGTGVELVLLDGPCRRWQFALGETAALDNLRCRYGTAVRFGNRGLLAQHQPSEYVPTGDDDGDVPVPDWAEESPDAPESGGSFRSGGESFADLAGRIDRSTDSFADVDPESPVAGDAKPTREAASGDVAALLDDLSEVLPIATADESDPASPATSSTPVLGSSSRERDEEPGAIDELFRGLERDVATRGRDGVDDAADPTRRTDPEATPEAVTAVAVVEDGDSEFVWIDERSVSSREDRP
ncbi:hypothetical protein [Natronoarchaeum mannanilyticum]|uniref:Halobacterial output domain-containing protein n=1 Tax=Natronoarchaeum mannanilyticum TaxID=926360 RepID=A0AAV3T4H7_9EURY